MFPRARWQRMILLAGLLSCAGAVLAEPPPLDAYGGLPGVEDMSISPSGGSLAVVGRVHEERRLLVFGPGQKLQTAAPLADTKLRYIRWVGEEQVLTHDSIVGTTFRSRVVGETAAAGRHAVLPEVEGMAYRTGEHRFVLDPRDDVGTGFVLR